MTKIFLEKIIKADRKKVFTIATDYQNFQVILPQFYPSVRIISVRGNTSLVEEHLRIAGRELIMMIKHVIDYPVLHEIFVIGGDAKGTHIITRFESIPEGTKLTLNGDWKLNGLSKLLGIFENKKIVNDYSKIIDEFILIVEH